MANSRQPPIRNPQSAIRKRRSSGAVSRGGAAACASGLIGASAAMAMSGLMAGLDDVVGAGSLSHQAMIGGALFAGAVGVRVPQRLALWICAAAVRRLAVRKRVAATPDVLSDRTGVDLPLYWVVFSVVALAAGILTTLLPQSVRLAGSVHDWLHVHFVFSDPLQAADHAALSFVTGFVPLAAFGLVVSCAHHVHCRYGAWDTHATGWLLIGAAGGALGSVFILRTNGQGGLLMVAAALPALLAALVGVASSSRRGADRASTEAMPVPLPNWSDRWPTLLRAGIVAAAVSATFVAAVWHSLLTGVAGDAGSIAAAMLAAFGLGFLAGRRAKLSGRTSIGGFGVACAAAGIIAAVGAAALMEPIAIGPGARFAAACASVAAAGFASAYGHQTILTRVASRSSVGAVMLARILAGSGLVVWIGAPAATHLLGQAAAIFMVGLLLLALGGTLIIHEPCYSLRTRRVRLCVVFGSIGLMLAVVSYANKSTPGSIVSSPTDFGYRVTPGDFPPGATR